MVPCPPSALPSVAPAGVDDGQKAPPRCGDRSTPWLLRIMAPLTRASRYGAPGSTGVGALYPVWLAGAGSPCSDGRHAAATSEMARSSCLVAPSRARCTSPLSTAMR